MDSETFLRYLDFLVATKLRWTIYNYARQKSDQLALFEAVKRSNLERIHVSLLDPDAAITAMTHHPTLKSITITCRDISLMMALIFRLGDELPPPGASGLFDAFATIRQLSKVVITRSGDIETEEFNAFLRFLQSAKQLTVLKVRYTFTDEQMLGVVRTLEELPNLEEIALGSLALDEGVLKSLGQFVAARPHLKYCFKSNYSYEGQDVLKPYIKSSKPTLKTTRTERLSASDTSLSLPLPNLEVPFVDLLPLDTLKLILYHLNIRPLMRLSGTSKRAREYCLRTDFWREYYLRHFDTLPAEVLETVSLLHGEILLRANSINDARPANIWLLALRHMTGMYRGPSLENFPDDPALSHLRRAIEKRYPQFIGYHMGPVRYQEKDADDTVWFMKCVGEEDYLKLGFRKGRTGVYSGILMQGRYYEDHTSKSKPWEMIEFVFDWQCATSAEELMDKCKDMCEAYLLAYYRHDWNDKHTMYFRVVAPSVVSSLELFDSVQQKINATIDTWANQLCVRVHGESEIISKLEGIKDVPVQSNNADYAVHQQRLKKRSDLNRHEKRYWRGSDWMDFHTLKWVTADESQEHPGEIPTTAVASPRPKKMIPKVLLMRLVRTVLNVVVMPLLRIFWPQDLMHADSNYYAVFVDGQLLNAYKARYSKNFTPIEHVTVSSASPHCWPIIALGVANLIIGDICQVTEAWVADEQEIIEAKVSDLIASLTRFNLFSASHLKAVRAVFLGEK